MKGASLSVNLKTGFQMIGSLKTQQQIFKIMEQVKNLWTSYLNWITEHPHLATDIETSLKWISYIATGTFKVYDLGIGNS